VMLFFAIASLGLPGLGNFVGEFLVLLGSYRVDATLTAVAALGLVGAVIYALILLQKTFHGEPREGLALADLTPRDTAIMAAMIVIIAWLGLYPQPVLDTAEPALAGLQQFVIEPAPLAGVAP
jgi:NADH-quinone oxidoreductase subunit M